MRIITAVGLLFFVISCDNQNKKISTGEGFVKVKGGEIWYQVIGNGDKTPMVMLHGGPGFPSYYLTPLFELAKDRQIIVYDQLSCGRSTNSEDTTLMNIESQLSDLKILLKELKVTNFYLYGHSYGSMLAVSYYLKGENLPKALILASPFMDAKTWVADSYVRVNSMDSIFSKPINNFIKGNFKDTTNYSQALKEYYSLFYNKKMNAYLDSSIARSGRKLALQMAGSEEFGASGNLKDYNLIGELHKIKIPVLFTTGEFDVAMPNTVKHFQSLTPNARFVVIRNAGHSTMNDNTEADLKAISDFLSELEN